MQDTKKTKKQLIQELVALLQRLAACEAFNRQHQQTADALPESEAHFASDIGSCIDITERKQMEEALRESEARYRALVEGAIQAISIVRNSRRVFANQAYATMFSYDSLLELLGRPVMDCIAPHDRDRLRHNAAALLRGEPALTRYEYQGVKKDGTLLWVETLVAPVSFQGKTALQVTLQDISERKRAEEVLTHA